MNIAIIPARGGSKRIPKKNIKLFHGKPLIAYSIETAIKTGLFDKIIVSTDDNEIATIAQEYGAEVPFIRPKELSDDFSSSGDAVEHAIKYLQNNGETIDFVCTIYATSPFLQVKYLLDGYEKLKNSNAHQAFSVTSMPFPIQRTFKITDKRRCKMFTPQYFSYRSQDLEEAYQDAGQFYWKNLNVVPSGIPFGEDSIPIVLPRYLVQDIDTMEDFEKAEIMYEVIQRTKVQNVSFFNKTFKIDGVSIGEGCKPYIIAEMSANHANDINVAIEIIKEAKKCGADAVKIQTYTADTLTLNCQKKVYEAKGAWQGVYLYDLYQGASMPWEFTPKLQEIAREVGITLFSSPFDFTSVDFLEKLNMPAYKIASPEIVDLPLIRRIAQTKKPIIMSTGNATLEQIKEAVDILIDEGTKDLAILKCTSEYPAPPEKINLKTIQDIQQNFQCPVGLSDHTLGSAIPIASVAMNASIIEKHFIISRKTETADSFFSATPDELKAIVDGTRMVYKAVGQVEYPLTKDIQRSLIVTKEIEEGGVLINGVNFKSLRPGGGIEPKYLDKIEGKVAKRRLEFGELLQWDMID